MSPYILAQCALPLTIPIIDLFSFCINYQKTQLDTIYLDFSKMFNKVPHNMLLHKLHQLGIDSNLWLLLQH